MPAHIAAVENACFGEPVDFPLHVSHAEAGEFHDLAQVVGLVWVAVQQAQHGSPRFWKEGR